jgi:hypothetical protein
MFLAEAVGRLYSETCPEFHPRICRNSTGGRDTMSAISRRRFIGNAAAASAIPLIGSSAHAQTDWPTKPIKIIAGYPAGGQTDLFARTYGEYIRS